MFPLIPNILAYYSGGVSPPTWNSDFNWAAGSLPSGVTHGGGANGTVVNSSGIVTAGSAGRITYDPITLSCLGIYLEKASTNYALMSTNFGDANWNSQDINRTANAITSPDGASNGTLSAGDSTNGVAHEYWNDGVSAYNPSTANWTVSAFFKVGNNPYVFLTGCLGTGTSYFAGSFNIGATPAFGLTDVMSGTTIYSYGIRPYSSNWNRIWISGKSLSNANANFQCGTLDALSPFNSATNYGEYNSSGNESFYIWQGQQEVADFATSPIFTTTGSVTRSIDTATTTNSTYLSQNAYLIQGRTAEGLPSSGTQILWQNDNGTTSNTETVYRDTSGNIHLKVVSGGTQVCDLNSSVTVSNYTDFKVAIRIVSSNFGISVNGSTAVTQASGTAPSVTTGRFGCDTASANSWNGTIARVQGASTMTDAQLKLVST